MTNPGITPELGPLDSGMLYNNPPSYFPVIYGISKDVLEDETREIDTARGTISIQIDVGSSSMPHIEKHETPILALAEGLATKAFRADESMIFAGRSISQVGSEIAYLLIENTFKSDLGEAA
jgi:hypothetical protein